MYTRLLLLDSAHASLLCLECLIGQPEPGLHVLQEDECVSVLDVARSHSFVLATFGELAVILTQKPNQTESNQVYFRRL